MSDFHLIPIEKKDNPNWEYRAATWPVNQVDPHVHDLFDGTRLDPVKYQRVRLKDGKLENCQVVKNGDDVIMEQGNGWNYLVKRINTNNKLNHDDDQDNESEDVPHDIKCDVCFIRKKTYVMLDCNHVCLCEQCSIIIYNTTRICPICNTYMTKPAMKLIFS